MKQFADVFAWEYSDLKTYDKNIIQHKIPLEKDTIPLKKKLRPINPMLLPLIEKEIKKLLATKITVPLRNSKWIANLVVVRKKSGEIRLCVDFRNLNKCSKKDNYPLPKMEHLLQKVSGAKVTSFIDGFSGFNQVVVHPDDQEKTAFTIPWGTFMYAKIPFGLMNVGATFQRAMDIAFVGEKDKFVLIYLDDITIYSSSHQSHLEHLKKVFLKCRRFRILVNPKKSQFALEEGKLLGHIVSATSVRIDTKRVKAIQTFSVPRSKKDIQSFLGKINFVRRFIPNFAELVKCITSMLRKGLEVRWTDARSGPCQVVSRRKLQKFGHKPYVLEFRKWSREEGITAELDRRQLVAENIASCDWYSVIIKFMLKLEIPPSFTQGQSRTIKLRTARYCINENLLYWRDPSGVLLRCLDKEQSMEVMQHFHSSMCGGHHYWNTTAHKILKAGYYWPSLFSDVFSFVKSCDRCQRFEGKQQLKSLPLKPIFEKGPFQQWGLYFIREINPHSNGQHRWILLATDYFTRWIEEIPTRKADHNVVMKFLIENNYTRFGCPHKLVTDNASAFKAKELVDMCNSMGIKLIQSTSYYPQGNGLA
eukprot:PITA_03432